MLQGRNYWLMKSEPAVFSIDDLKKDGFTNWEGVRNYQARNFMRDQMKVGDLVLFYHSNAVPSGIVGICRVCREAHPDTSALDSKSEYYDPKASIKNPIWMMVEVEFVEKFPAIITLEELKKNLDLKGMRVLRRGSRLSVLPVEERHFEIIKEMAYKELSTLTSS